MKNNDERRRTERRTEERRTHTERRLNLAFRAYSDDTGSRSGRRVNEYRRSGRRNDSG